MLVDGSMILIENPNTSAAEGSHMFITIDVNGIACTQSALTDDNFCKNNTSK